MSSQATIPNPAQAAAQPQAASMPAAIPGVAPGASATPAATAANNPAVAPGAVPQTNGVNWVDGSNTVIGDFKDTYGSGTGTALAGALQGLGTSTSSAVAATTANTNLEANNQYKNIQATEAAQGITPNSSTAALAQGDFYSQVNSSLQATTANMEESEQSQLIAALTGEGTAHGTDSTWEDTLGNVLSGGLGGEALQGIGAGANALNETSASGTGGLSSALSLIGEL